MSDITDFLPQRAPFLFVDAIHSADVHEIIGSKVYDETFLYCQGHFPARPLIPQVILLESLVQCGGAGIAKLGVTENALWGLATIDNVRFYTSVKPPATVKMVIKNGKISNRILKQTGVSFCNDTMILEATWSCLRFK